MSSLPSGELVAALLRSRPEPGVVVRAARMARHWSQADLGRRCGYSASQISRWESGKLPLRDVDLLRTLAEVLALPPTLFGLTVGAERACTPSVVSGHRVARVTTPLGKEVDPVRRRAFLQLAAVTGGTLACSSTTGAMAATNADPAQILADELGAVLLGPMPEGVPASTGVLTEVLAEAQQEFAAYQYLPLARRLPTLIATAEASAAQRFGPRAAQVLADSYNLTTRVLSKLEASGLEWVAADRALHAARLAENPLTLAESERLVAAVARRAGHYARAQELTLAAAEHLTVHVSSPVPEHLAMYSALHASAAHAAARAGDRERAGDLLAEAGVTAARLAEGSDGHRRVMANLVSHQVSAAYLVGDVGAALTHAGSIPLAAIPTVERRARLLVDTAQAWARWDRPDQAYRTLLLAERTAPGEVRTRNTARRLAGDLLAGPGQSAMPGLPALARRMHAIS